VHGRSDAPGASLNHVEMASQIIQELGNIFLDGGKELKKLLDEADECTARIQRIENILPSS